MGRVVTPSALQPLRAEFRNRQQRVVFTNGVFDIIHRGHVEYLGKAKALGDILIVGINNDSSVRRIKGEKRPVVPEQDRAYVLANLCPVDFVCMFEQDTPYELIRSLVPDILVKGADWSIENIIGKDIVEAAGGTVTAIDFTPDRSTTNIIERILERYS